MNGEAGGRAESDSGYGGRLPGLVSWAAAGLDLGSRVLALDRRGKPSAGAAESHHRSDSSSQRHGRQVSNGMGLSSPSRTRTPDWHGYEESCCRSM